MKNHIANIDIRVLKNLGFDIKLEYILNIFYFLGSASRGTLVTRLKKLNFFKYPAFDTIS